MSFLSGIFGKKNPIGPILSALLSFKGDMASLNRLKVLATPMFGSDWHGALESYIASTVEAGEEQAKLLDALGKVAEYDNAQILWRTAQLLLSGAALPVNIETQMPEFKKYLPLFGPEGEILYEKLKLKFPQAAGENKAPPPAPDEPILKRADFPQTQSQTRSEPRAEPAEKLSDWDVDNFTRLLEFINLAKHVMPMMVANGAADSLEDYPGYVLLPDAYDVAIAKANELMDKPEQVLNSNFEKGAATLREILETLETERENEIRPEPAAKGKKAPVVHLDLDDPDAPEPPEKPLAKKKKKG